MLLHAFAVSEVATGGGASSCSSVDMSPSTKDDVSQPTTLLNLLLVSERVGISRDDEQAAQSVVDVVAAVSVADDDLQRRLLLLLLK